ncbi:lytic transglycosylase domain-containing protein [Clostridium sp. UBA7503]|uniref:lytic transglycosylase domain-containing protein n=1 Tax=Clostridium sp. UBA7503 TaxID=1946377 RepID=UPI003216526C
MSYDVGSVYGGINNYINSIATNGNTNSSIGSVNNGITQNQYVNGLGILNDTLSSGTGSDALTGLMSLGLMSGSFGGGSDSSTSSSTSGFSLIMASLLKAMGEKERQTQQGIDQNNRAYNSTYNGINDISNVIIRAIGGVTPSTVVSATGTDSERIEKAIADASTKYGVNANLIRAIIKTESNFNPNAVSPAGAKGLMQLMPCNIDHYGVNDPFNIEQNIDAGTRHIKDYLKTYNYDLNMALAAYNFGPGNMASRGIGSSSDFYKLPSETKNYLAKINNLI